jgi:hypothetical protein
LTWHRIEPSELFVISAWMFGIWTVQKKVLYTLHYESTGDSLPSGIMHE